MKRNNYTIKPLWQQRWLLKLCVALLVLASYPYTGGAQINTFPYQVGFDDTNIPDGWSNEYVTGTTNWTFVTANGNSTVFPRTGERMAEFRVGNSTAVTKLITPALDLSGLSTPYLSFWYANTNWVGDIDRMQVFYKTSADGEWTALAPEISAEHTEWTEFSIELPSPSDDYYIAFEGRSEYARGFNMDDLYVGEAPTCLPPTDITMDAMSESSVSFSWAEPSTEPTGYEYAITTDDTPPASGTEITDSFLTDNSLSSETNYYLHIRSVCGAEYSSWVKVSFFTGYCSVSSTNTSDYLSSVSSLGAVANINYTATSMPSGGYSNQTTQPFSSFDGQLITINTTYVGGSNGVNIWVDWNQNLNFDDDELVASLTNTSASKSLSFTVPENTPNGEYRVRIRAQYGSTANPPACGQVNYGSVIDFNLSVGDVPACAPPVSGSASNVGLFTATISWTGPVDAPGFGYEYVISETNETPSDDADTGTDVADTTTDISGLQPSTTYYIFVRSECAEGSEYSTWVMLGSFSTTLATNIPWSEGFATTTLPAGWALSSYNGPGTVTALNPDASGYYLYKNLWSTSSSTGSFTTINVGPLTGVESLSFDYKIANYSSPYNPPAAGSGNFTVEISTDFGANYILLDDVANSEIAGWQTFEHPLDAFAGEYIKIRITANWVSEDYYAGFDNFQIASCTPPIDVTLENMTGTSADFSWTAPSSNPGEYEYAFTTENTPPASGTLTDETFASDDTLTEETSYYFHVRSVCSEDDLSSWVTIPFYTGHCQVTSTNTSYGISNFSTTGGTTNINNPSGGSAYSDYTDQAVTSYAGGSVDFTITGIDNDIHGMGLWIDWNNNLSFDDPGEHIYNSGSYIAQGTGTINVPVDATDGSYRMRVVANWLTMNPTACGDLGSASYGEAEDYTFIVTDAPSCLPPSNIVVSAVTSTNATFSWDASVSDPANGYVWEITDEDGIVDSGTTTELTVSTDALSAQSEYTFSVYSACEDADSGVSSVNIETPCDVISDFPFTETFEEDSSSLDCWSVSSEDGGAAWSLRYGSTYSDVSMPHSGDLNASLSGTGIAYLFSPTFDLSSMASTGAELVFWYANPNYSTLQDELSVFYQNSAGGDWNLIPDAEYTTSVGTWTEVVLSLPEISDYYTIAFVGFADAENLVVDDVTIRAGEVSCPAPTGVVVSNITTTSADISWTGVEPAPEGGYEWTVLDAEGEIVATGDTESTEASVSDLDFGTTYTVEVIAICGDDNESAAATAVFTTVEIMGCTDEEACNYNPDATTDDGSCLFEVVTWYEDADGDGYGNPDVSTESCTPVEGYVLNGTDCDDNDDTAWQSAELYADEDGDGYYGTATTVCYGDEIPDGYALTNNDCDDDDDTVWQSTELYVDEDGDGYHSSSEVLCYGEEIPEGYTDETLGEDCDDSDAEVWQSATLYLDEDGDGRHGSSDVFCYGEEMPEGYTDETLGEDCDDSDAEVWQSATLYLDQDGDGYHGSSEIFCYGEEMPDGYTDETLGEDCDDSDAEVWQSALLYLDEDGDGRHGSSDVFCFGEEMPEGYTDETLGEDCNDNDSSIWEAVTLSVDIVLPQDMICDNASPLTLSGGTPAGGVWSGQSVTNGVFNPAGLSAGNYTITYTVAGDGVCITGSSASANIEVDDCSGIDEDYANQIRLYPTFTNNHVTVSGIALTDAIITDMNGKLLNTVSLNGTNTIDMQPYAAGIYFIRVNSNTTSEVFKVIKVN